MRLANPLNGFGEGNPIIVERTKTITTNRNLSERGQCDYKPYHRHKD